RPTPSKVRVGGKGLNHHNRRRPPPPGAPPQGRRRRDPPALLRRRRHRTRRVRGPVLRAVRAVLLRGRVDPARQPLSDPPTARGVLRGGELLLPALAVRGPAPRLVREAPD